MAGGEGTQSNSASIFSTYVHTLCVLYKRWWRPAPAAPSSTQILLALYINISIYICRGDDGGGGLRDCSKFRFIIWYIFFYSFKFIYFYLHYTDLQTKQICVVLVFLKIKIKIQSLNAKKITSFWPNQSSHYVGTKFRLSFSPIWKIPTAHAWQKKKNILDLRLNNILSIIFIHICQIIS